MISGDTVVLACVCVLDMLTTLYFMSIGVACEGNPLMATFAAMGTTHLVVAKIVSFLPFLVIIEIYRLSQPRNARILTRMVTFIYLSAYVWGTLHINFSP